MINKTYFCSWDGCMSYTLVACWKAEHIKTNNLHARVRSCTLLYIGINTFLRSMRVQTTNAIGNIWYILPSYILCEVCVHQIYLHCLLCGGEGRSSVNSSQVIGFINLNQIYITELSRFNKYTEGMGLIKSIQWDVFHPKISCSLSFSGM